MVETCQILPYAKEKERERERERKKVERRVGLRKNTKKKKLFKKCLRGPGQGWMVVAMGVESVCKFLDKTTAN